MRRCLVDTVRTRCLGMARGGGEGLLPSLRCAVSQSHHYATDRAVGGGRRGAKANRSTKRGGDTGQQKGKHGGLQQQRPAEGEKESEEVLPHRFADPQPQEEQFLLRVDVSMNPSVAAYSRLMESRRAEWRLRVEAAEGRLADRIAALKVLMASEDAEAAVALEQKGALWGAERGQRSEARESALATKRRARRLDAAMLRRRGGGDTQHLCASAGNPSSSSSADATRCGLADDGSSGGMVYNNSIGSGGSAGGGIPSLTSVLGDAGDWLMSRELRLYAEGATEKGKGNSEEEGCRRGNMGGGGGATDGSDGADQEAMLAVVDQLHEVDIQMNSLLGYELSAIVLGRGGPDGASQPNPRSAAGSASCSPSPPTSPPRSAFIAFATERLRVLEHDAMAASATHTNAATTAGTRSRRGKASPSSPSSHRLASSSSSSSSLLESRLSQLSLEYQLMPSHLRQVFELMAGGGSDGERASLYPAMTSSSSSAADFFIELEAFIHFSLSIVQSLAKCGIIPLPPTATTPPSPSSEFLVGDTDASSSLHHHIQACAHGTVPYLWLGMPLAEREKWSPMIRAVRLRREAAAVSQQREAGPRRRGGKAQGASPLPRLSSVLKPLPPKSGTVPPSSTRVAGSAAESVASSSSSSPPLSPTRTHLSQLAPDDGPNGEEGGEGGSCGVADDDDPMRWLEKHMGYTIV